RNACRPPAGLFLTHLKPKGAVTLYRQWTSQTRLRLELFGCAVLWASHGHPRGHNRRRDKSGRNTPGFRTASCRAQWCAACLRVQKMCPQAAPANEQTAPRALEFRCLSRISPGRPLARGQGGPARQVRRRWRATFSPNLARSEEHTSELQSQSNLVCRLLLEKKKKNRTIATIDMLDPATPQHVAE